MPKQKTHKGLKKRFRLTASGKVKHKRAGASHLLSHKTAKRKRKLAHAGTLKTVEVERLKHLLTR